MSTKAEPTFTTTGFSNWKKATTRFKEHESSQAHRDAVFAHVSANSTSVNAMLQSQVNSVQATRRSSLMKQLTALRYLLRQGLSIRNDHAGGSNLSVMLQHVLEDVTWVKSGKYQSPEIINEMIKLMGHKVLRSLVNELLAHRWFSLLADETRDVSNREQLVITLRWVSEKYEINEDFSAWLSWMKLQLIVFIHQSRLSWCHWAYHLIIAGDKDMTEHEISKAMSVELPRDLRMIIRLLFLCIVLHIVLTCASKI